MSSKLPRADNSQDAALMRCRFHAQAGEAAVAQLVMQDARNDQLLRPVRF